MAVVIWKFEQIRDLAHARRDVCEGARRLAAQQRRLKTLRAAGRDTTDAEILLHACEDSQLLRFARLVRLEDGTRRGVAPRTDKAINTVNPLLHAR